MHHNLGVEVRLVILFKSVLHILTRLPGELRRVTRGMTSRAG